MSSSNFNMRLDDDLRASVYPILEQYGLTPSQAVRMFLNQIARTGKVPLTFDWAEPEPNSTTLAAVEEFKNGGGTRYSSAEAAMSAMMEIASEGHE